MSVCPSFLAVSSALSNNLPEPFTEEPTAEKRAAKEKAVKAKATSNVPAGTTIMRKLKTREQAEIEGEKQVFDLILITFYH